MNTLLVLLVIAWFAVAIWLRKLSLLGKNGLVHRATRLTRQSIAYHKRLERNLHAQGF